LTNLLSPSKLSFTFLHEYRGDLARTSIIIIKSVPLTYKDYSLENYWHGMNVILKGIEQCIPTNLYIASFLLTSRRQVIPFRFILKKMVKEQKNSPLPHSRWEIEKKQRMRGGMMRKGKAFSPSCSPARRTNNPTLFLSRSSLTFDIWYVMYVTRKHWIDGDRQ